MTDAPERIWAWRYTNPDTDKKEDMGEWYTEDVGLDGDEIEYVRADLVPAWQPIETAPKNKIVLVWSEKWTVPYLIEAELNQRGWSAGGFDISNPNQPTHWMPIPKPPKVSE